MNNRDLFEEAVEGFVRLIAFTILSGAGFILFSGTINFDISSRVDQWLLFVAGATCYRLFCKTCDIIFNF